MPYLDCLHSGRSGTSCTICRGYGAASLAERVLTRKKQRTMLEGDGNGALTVDGNVTLLL
jgi:hypothetical protein